MSIASECLVLNLHIGIWTGQRLDKAATANVTRDAGAESDAARVNKHLIAKTALKDVTSASYAVRTHFYSRTLPWKDNGDRVISRKAFAEFIAEHERLVGVFNEQVQHFAYEVYPAEVARASFRMGELFDPDDYPSSAEVARRFHAGMDIDPVSEASDFRVEMDEKHAQRIRDQIEKATEERLARAMASVWEQITTVLQNYITRTKAGTGIRVELVNNLREIVEIMPELNITDDPRLAEIQKMIGDKLVGHEAKDLREDETLRETARADAQAIMDRMRGFTAAMGAA
jgi:hypothetical protein